MTFFSDVLCVSRPCELNACLAKAKNYLLNKYTKVGKRCFNLNRKANYRPHLEFDEMTEERISISILLFTGIPVTIYSTIELFDSVIVLGFTPQNLRKNAGGAVDEIKVPQASFLTKERKNKKEEKMIRLEPRLSQYQTKALITEPRSSISDAVVRD